MSRFPADWLALREPVDGAARSRIVLSHLAGWQAKRAASRPFRVLDIGCGTGSSVRALAPHLTGIAHWHLVDNDPALLAICRANLGQDTVLTAHIDCVDLSRTDLGTLVAPADLVTASALLDLVSHSWLEALWAALVRFSVPLYAALTYDGRMVFDPSSDDDPEIRRLVNTHQRRDKGFGPALGPGAVDALMALARQSGWTTISEPSDWRLESSRHQAVLSWLFRGWIAAALEQQPDRREIVERWHVERRSAGDLHVEVGHRDILALPA